jgi:hypothetical protein
LVKLLCCAVATVYALVDASADHNLGAGLNLQKTYGAGAGYAVIRKPVQTLDVKGDVHFSRQEFYPAGPGLADVSLNVIGINVGEIYTRKLVHGMAFNESALVQPAFNHPSAFTAQFVAGLQELRRLAWNAGQLHQQPAVRIQEQHIPLYCGIELHLQVEGLTRAVQIPLSVTAIV